MIEKSKVLWRGKTVS